MIKKKRISQPDLDDWLDYIKNPKDIYDKEPKEESNEDEPVVIKMSKHKVTKEKTPPRSPSTVNKKKKSKPSIPKTTKPKKAKKE